MAESEPMERMSFTVPAPTKRRAQARHDVNWSAVVARAIEDKLRALEVLDRIADKLDLAQVDADEVAEAIDEAVAKRFKAARA
jgi:hypothetical protein